MKELVAQYEQVELEAEVDENTGEEKMKRNFEKGKRNKFSNCYTETILYL